MWLGHGAPVTSITLSHILNAYLDLDKGKVEARLITIVINLAPVKVLMFLKGGLNNICEMAKHWPESWKQCCQ